MSGSTWLVTYLPQGSEEFKCLKMVNQMNRYRDAPEINIGQVVLTAAQKLPAHSQITGVIMHHPGDEKVTPNPTGGSPAALQQAVA